jgi:uncharacterized membrane protein
MGERGLVLPLLAICLVAVLGFAGISVDVGFLEYRQQTQQSATDAAALGGAQQLVRAGCGSTAAAEAAAYADSLSISARARVTSAGFCISQPRR